MQFGPSQPGGTGHADLIKTSRDRERADRHNQYPGGTGSHLVVGGGTSDPVIVASNGGGPTFRVGLTRDRTDHFVPQKSHRFSHIFRTFHAHVTHMPDNHHVRIHGLGHVV